MGASQVLKNLPVMRDIWVWSLGWEDPLEEGMAIHSTILARKILWTEEPGKLHSMRSKKSRTEAAEQVRHLFVEIDY